MAAPIPSPASLMAGPAPIPSPALKDTVIGIAKLSSQLIQEYAQHEEEVAVLRAEIDRLKATRAAAETSPSPTPEPEPLPRTTLPVWPPEKTSVLAMTTDVEKENSKRLTSNSKPVPVKQASSFSLPGVHTMTSLRSMPSGLSEQSGLEMGEAQMKPLELPEALRSHFKNPGGVKKSGAPGAMNKSGEGRMHTAWKELYMDRQSEASNHGVVVFESLLKLSARKRKFSWRASVAEVSREKLSHSHLAFSTVWDFIGSFMIMTDVMVIPFQYALGLTSQRQTPTFYLQVTSMSYWALHCVFSLMPSCKRRRRYNFNRTKRYLSSFFLLDITLISLDIALLVEQFSADGQAKASGWTGLRMLRLVRIVRLKTIYSIEKDLEDSLAFRGQDWFIHVMTLIKCAGVLAMAGHLLGCFFVWLGRSWKNPEMTWLAGLEHADSAGQIYGTAVHFILGYITGAPVDCIMPMNHAERFFTFLLMLGSLLVLGYGVAQVQNTLQELTKSSALELSTRRRLQVYLCRINAPLEMSIRTVTFAMNAYRRRRSSDLDGGMHGLLSSRLLSEMTVIQRQNDLATHPLLNSLQESHQNEFNNICNAIKLHRYEEFETVFTGDVQAKGAYYTLHGKFKMTPHNDEDDVVMLSDPVWLCEVSLFMRYSHTCTLLSLTFAETLQLSMEDLIQCVKNSPHATCAVYAYGTAFLAKLFTPQGSSHSISPIGISDQLPHSVSEDARLAFSAQSGRGGKTQELDEAGNRIAPAKAQAMEEFTQDYLRGGDNGEADHDTMLDNIIINFQELNVCNGFYALAMEPDESKRCQCSMLNMIWLYKDRYDLFTAGQAEGAKLTEQQWKELRSIMVWSQAGPEEICALLVFLTIRGMGKVKAVVNLLPEAHRSPEKACMYIIEKAEVLVPSFTQLTCGMQDLIKGTFTVHDRFNFGQLIQGENLPSHIQDLQAHVEQHGSEILKFYLLSILGVFSGLLGMKRTAGSLFMNSTNGAKVMRGIQALQHLSTSAAVAIYWAHIVDYAQSLDLEMATTEDMLIARLSCLLRATSKKDSVAIQKLWLELNPRDRSILADVFLADGIEHPAFFFAFLPSYFDTARKNPCIGLRRAIILLVDLIEILKAGNQDDHPTIKVDLSELVNLAKTAEDAINFDLFMERVLVDYRGSETHFVVRNRAERGSSEAKLDQVARSIRSLARELHTLHATTADPPKPASSGDSSNGTQSGATTTAGSGSALSTTNNSSESILALKGGSLNNHSRAQGAADPGKLEIERLQAELAFLSEKVQVQRIRESSNAEPLAKPGEVKNATTHA